MSPDYERGLLRALAIADLFADENMRMADDTIKLDPILNREKRALITNPAQLEAASKVSSALEADGFMYASRSHAAKDIAEAIRAELKGSTTMPDISSKSPKTL